MKTILPYITSPTKSAFIPGRLVSDNYLVTTEVAHYMHKRTSRLNGLMALKLDISKVYDRLEWSFLEAKMQRMGFSLTWIHTIIMCVSTVTYSFKLKKDPVGYVKPGRRVRQRDPLYPYHLLCVSKDCQLPSS